MKQNLLYASMVGLSLKQQMTTVWAQPCIEETKLYGSKPIDPTIHRENFYYRDDDDARITKISGCKCCKNQSNQLEHFRGIEIETDGPGGIIKHKFGTMRGTDPDTKCDTRDVSLEELMYFTIYSDRNDIEGIVFEGNKGTSWSLRANGALSERFRMKGRPVGFRVWEGDFPKPNGPIKMSVVYNACNCPASTFEGIAFEDLECSVLPNKKVESPVEFQPNYMSSVYEQNCGTYGLETSPSLPFVDFLTSGDSVDQHGAPYPDIVSLDCGSVDNIGEHIVNVVIKQDIDEPTHGFDQPYRGIIPQIEMPLTVRINPCPLEKLVFEPISDIYYDVGTPGTFQNFTVQQEPECDYDIDFSVIEGQADWLELRSANSDLKVQTDDETSKGVYIVKIQASVDVYSDYTKTDKTTVTSETEVTVHIQSNPCKREDVIPANVIPDQVYSINFDNLVILSPEYVNELPDCPKEFHTKRIVDGVEQSFTEVEQKVVSSDLENGLFSINTDNFALHNETWTIKLSIISIESTSLQREAVFQFDIMFKDDCWEADVTPAQPIQPTFTFDLMQRQLIQLLSMVDNSFGAGVCGGYTYSLEYTQGYFYNSSDPAGADLSFYEGSIDSSYLQYNGTVRELEWIGSHFYRVKSTLGKFDSTVGSRGKNGLYNSFFSDPFEVEILDPCLKSIVNLDSSFFVYELIVPNEKTEEKFFFKGPTDSTSKKYGNGYDICGPLNYSLLDDSYGQFELSGLSSSVSKNSNAADNISFMLTVNQYGGSNIQTKFTLVAALVDYPTATPFTQEVFVTYRGCYPSKFRGPLIRLDPMMVGDPAFEIPVLFDQSPCMYDQEYTTVVYDRQSGDKVDIPKFMRPQGEIIFIDEPQTVDIGEYRVITCSTLNTFVQQESCIEFDLTVGPRPINFLYKVFDQRVKVGESLVYDLGMPVGNYDYLLKVDAFLGEAFRFTTFNSTTNVLEVYGDLTKADQVGEYPIIITAQLMIGEKFDKVYKRQFSLTVWDDQQIDLPWFPTNPIYYDEWNSLIVRANYSQEFSPDRPIPYIKELRTDGLLTIGWDRNMIVPQNYKEIEPARIAVEEEFVRRQTRKWQDGRKVRKLRSYEQFEILEDDLDLVYFADRNTRFFEQMKLLDALEILITPQDDEKAESIPILTWEMIGYSPDQIQLQLTFDDYHGIAGEAEYDTLSVTFWGIQFFKSNNNDKEVALGTTLYHPLSPQISKNDAGWIDGFTSFLKGLLITSLVLVALVIPFGSLLPFWVFINSLQIVSHMILLKSVMPAPIFWYLKSWNDMIRWYDPVFVDTLQSAQDWRRYSSNFETLHDLLQTGDYTPQLALNMAWISIVLLCLLLIWFIVALKDFIVSFSPKARKYGYLAQIDSSMCQNVVLRYVYVFWLEFCICVILELSTRDYRNFHHSLQYLAAIVCLFVMFAILCFIVSLFFRGGPQILGFYKPYTVSKSFLFEHRNRDQGFDGKTWLKNNKETPQNRPLGSFFIRFDTNRFLNKLPCGKKDRPEDPHFVPILDLDGLTVFEQKAKSLDADDNESKFERKSSTEGLSQPTERCLLTKREDMDMDIPIITIPLNISQETNTTQRQLERSNEVCDRKDEIQQKPIVVSQISQEKTEQQVYNHSFYEGGQIAAKDLKVFTKNESFAKFKETLDNRQTKDSTLDSESSSKDVLNFWASKEGHLRVKFAGRVKVAQAYKTLFFGLKLNTERNSAIVHPLMFLIRRLIYALIILFLDGPLHFGIILVLLCTLIMLAFALTEFQWQERVINWQHIMNEIVIYMTCVMFLFFSNIVSERIRWNLSYMLMGILCAYILANTIFIAHYASIQLKLLYKRVYLQRRRRRFLIQAWLKIQELYEQFQKEKQLRKQKPKIADLESLESQHNFDCKLIESEMEWRNTDLIKLATSATSQQDSKGDFECVIKIDQNQEVQDHSQGGVLQIMVQGDEQVYQKDTKIESQQMNKNDNLLIDSKRDQNFDMVSKSETFGSVSANNFNSEHGLVFQNCPIDLNEIEEEVHLETPKEVSIIESALDQKTLGFTRSRTDNKISKAELKPAFSEINQQEFKHSETVRMNQQKKNSEQTENEGKPDEMQLEKSQKREFSVCPDYGNLRPSKSDMKDVVKEKSINVDQDDPFFYQKDLTVQTEQRKNKRHLQIMVELTPKALPQVDDSLNSKVLKRQNTDQKENFDSERKGSILKNSASRSLKKSSNGSRTLRTEFEHHQKNTTNEETSPRIRLDKSIDEIYQAMGRQSPKSNHMHGFQQHTRGINSQVFHEKYREGSQTCKNESSLSQYNDVYTIAYGANRPNQRSENQSSKQGKNISKANSRTGKTRAVFDYYQSDHQSLSRVNKNDPGGQMDLAELDQMLEGSLGALKAFRSKSKTERKRGPKFDMSPIYDRKSREKDPSLERNTPLAHTGMSILGAQPQRSYTQTKQYVCQTEKRRDRRNRSGQYFEQNI